MTKLILLLCLFAVAALLIKPAQAATLGPFPDWNGTFEQTPVTITIDDFLGVQFHIPFDGDVSIGVPSHHTLTVNVPVPVFVPTYITISDTPPPGVSLLDTPLLLTDIVGLATGWPSGTTDTGFDPNNPQVVLAGPSFFIGNSGTQYACVDSTSTLGNLAAQLPGFDLSGFSGDPNTIVYVSQGVVPLWDAEVPEPSSLLLGITGTFTMLAYALRRRTRTA